MGNFRFLTEAFTSFITKLASIYESFIEWHVLGRNRKKLQWLTSQDFTALGSGNFFLYESNLFSKTINGLFLIASGDRNACQGQLKIGPHCVHVWLARPPNRRWTLVGKYINL